MTTTVDAMPDTGVLIYVQLEDLEPNPANVRTTYDKVALKELAASIAQRGLLQPIRVTDNSVEGSTKPFMIVAGHRRRLALLLLQEQGVAIPPIPAIQATLDTGAAGVLVDSLIENLQRVDISPLDEARGYAQLMEMGWKNKQLADTVGRSHGHVSKRLALLGLPTEAQKAVDRGWLDLGTAYALTQLPLERLLEIFTDPDGNPDMPTTEEGWAECTDGDWLADQVSRLAREVERDAGKAKLERKLKGLGYTVLTEVLRSEWQFVAEHPATDTPELAEGLAVRVTSPDHFHSYAPIERAPEPTATEAGVTVEAIEGESDADRIKRERLAKFEADEAAAKEAEKVRKAAAAEKRTTAIAHARELLVKPKKADVLELAWREEFERQTNPRLYGHLHRAVVQILDVEPERSPRANDPEKLSVDYAKTIEVYLAGDDFKAKAEVYLAFRAAAVIEQGMSDEALRDYAKSRDIELS